MAVLTKIDASLAHLRKAEDLDDLARVLFPGNRCHQHACAVIFFSLKWSDGVVVDLARCAREYGVTRRVFERTRAKMRRLGLIEHVSRFNHRHGHRDGWILSGRFERSLQHLAERIGQIRRRTRSPSACSGQENHAILSHSRRYIMDHEHNSTPEEWPVTRWRLPVGR